MLYIAQFNDISIICNSLYTALASVNGERFKIGPVSHLHAAPRRLIRPKWGIRRLSPASKFSRVYYEPQKQH